MFWLKTESNFVIPRVSFEQYNHRWRWTWGRPPFPTPPFIPFFGPNFWHIFFALCISPQDYTFFWCRKSSFPVFSSIQWGPNSPPLPWSSKNLVSPKADRNLVLHFHRQPHLLLSPTAQSSPRPTPLFLHNPPE